VTTSRSAETLAGVQRVIDALRAVAHGTGSVASVRRAVADADPSDRRRLPKAWQPIAECSRLYLLSMCEAELEDGPITDEQSAIAAGLAEDLTRIVIEQSSPWTSGAVYGPDDEAVTPSFAPEEGVRAVTSVLRIARAVTRRGMHVLSDEMQEIAGVYAALTPSCLAHVLLIQVCEFMLPQDPFFGAHAKERVLGEADRVMASGAAYPIDKAWHSSFARAVARLAGDETVGVRVFSDSGVVVLLAESQPWPE